MYVNVEQFDVAHHVFYYKQKLKILLQKKIFFERNAIKGKSEIIVEEKYREKLILNQLIKEKRSGLKSILIT